MSRSTPGHEQLEHPADVALRLWAPTEELLLLEGARAIVKLLCSSAEISPTASRALDIDSLDAEDRLVRFMNEVLLLATMDGFLVADATITLREQGLSAVLRGEPHAQGRVVSELKSVTYHDLSIEHDEVSWVATVVVDV